MEYCSECGAELSGDETYCPECGYEIADTEADRSKDPVGAAVLSYFVPGLGQLHNGQHLKGAVIFFFVGILLAVVFASMMRGSIITSVVVFVFAAMISLASVADAYTQAKRIDRGDDPQL